MQSMEMFEDMHRHCDDLLCLLDHQVQCEEWMLAEATYSRLRTGMRAHFEAEEEELFPAFERAAGASAISTVLMRGEHHRMSGMMDYMGGALAVCDVGAYLGESLRLRTLLVNHGRKEDFLMETVFGHSRGDISRDIT